MAKRNGNEKKMAYLQTKKKSPAPLDNHDNYASMYPNSPIARPSMMATGTVRSDVEPAMSCGLMPNLVAFPCMARVVEPMSPHRMLEKVTAASGLLAMMFLGSPSVADLQRTQATP